MNREPLGFLLGAAGRKVAKMYTAALADDVVSPSQLYVLRQLWREDGLALVDLRSALSSMRRRRPGSRISWRRPDLSSASAMILTGASSGSG